MNAYTITAGAMLLVLLLGWSFAWWMIGYGQAISQFDQDDEF